MSLGFGIELKVESTDYLNLVWTYLINILKYPPHHFSVSFQNPIAA